MDVKQNTLDGEEQVIDSSSPSNSDETDVGVIRLKSQIHENAGLVKPPNNEDSQNNSATDLKTSDEDLKTVHTNQTEDATIKAIGPSLTKGTTDCINDILVTDKETVLTSSLPSTSTQFNVGDGLRLRSHKEKDLVEKEMQDGSAELIHKQLVVETCDDEDDSAWEDDEEVEDEEGETHFEDKEHSGLIDIPYPGVHVLREEDPELPDTVATLTADNGSKIYVVGTAHFSESSQDDVSKTIQATQPDIVMVELCNSRVNILQLDEETLLEEAKNINMDKVKSAIRQSGMVQGIMHLLLLSMSAHLTKQLGMAPGGEFRRAFKEAQKIPGCRIHLGDRPIQITLRRALGSLSLWQKTRLAWYMITSKEPISKEEVEKCKNKDLLEEMLREMTGEFPALSSVFVKERDMFLANSLRIAAKPIPNPNTESGTQPAVVVGVVGIGHLPGIVENWGTQANMRELMKVPPASTAGIAMKWSVRAVLLGTLSWSCYKLYRLGANVLSITYRNMPAIRNK